MLVKFLLKNGPGSPGHTAKVLIKHFNKRQEILISHEPSDIYASILIDRICISQSTGQSCYYLLNDLDRVKRFLENDISTFTFLVLFFESEKVRKAVVPNMYGDSSFDIITEVIYEVCKKRSNLCSLSLIEFRKKADKICHFLI